MSFGGSEGQILMPTDSAAASKHGQFILTCIACIFKKRHYKALVLSLWCLGQRK